MNAPDDNGANRQQYFCYFRRNMKIDKKSILDV